MTWRSLFLLALCSLLPWGCLLAAEEPRDDAGYARALADCPTEEVPARLRRLRALPDEALDALPADALEEGLAGVTAEGRSLAPASAANVWHLLRAHDDLVGDPEALLAIGSGALAAGARGWAASEDAEVARDGLRTLSVVGDALVEEVGSVHDAREARERLAGRWWGGVGAAAADLGSDRLLHLGRWVFQQEGLIASGAARPAAMEFVARLLAVDEDDLERGRILLLAGTLLHGWEATGRELEPFLDAAGHPDPEARPGLADLVSRLEVRRVVGEDLAPAEDDRLDRWLARPLAEVEPHTFPLVADAAWNRDRAIGWLDRAIEALGSPQGRLNLVRILTLLPKDEPALAECLDDVRRKRLLEVFAGHDPHACVVAVHLLALHDSRDWIGNSLAAGFGPLVASLRERLLSREHDGLDRIFLLYGFAPPCPLEASNRQIVQRALRQDPDVYDPLPLGGAGLCSQRWRAAVDADAALASLVADGGQLADHLLYGFPRYAVTFGRRWLFPAAVQPPEGFDGLEDGMYRLRLWPDWKRADEAVAAIFAGDEAVGRPLDCAAWLLAPEARAQRFAGVADLRAWLESATDGARSPSAAALPDPTEEIRREPLDVYECAELWWRVFDDRVRALELVSAAREEAGHPSRWDRGVELALRLDPDGAVVEAYRRSLDALPAAEAALPRWILAGRRGEPGAFPRLAWNALLAHPDAVGLVRFAVGGDPAWISRHLDRLRDPRLLAGVQRRRSLLLATHLLGLLDAAAWARRFEGDEEGSE